MSPQENKLIWQDFIDQPEQVMPYYIPEPEPDPDEKPICKFWEASPHTGRKRAYEDVDVFVSDCREYFEWNEKNPIMSVELVSFKGKSILADVPKIRAMTIEGLCIFLGITSRTFENYRKDGTQEFKDACASVQNIIYQQKLTGAAAGLLNANIISRELGLKDCSDVSSKDGSMTPKEPRPFSSFYANPPGKKNKRTPKE